MLWVGRQGVQNCKLLSPTYLFLLGFIVIWLGLATMKYIADEDSLVITWLHKRYNIPWSKITEVIKVSGRLNFISFLGSVGRVI